MKKILVVILSGLILIVLSMVISYFVAKSRLNALTPEIRAELPGEFIALENGVISYYWKGPVNGNIVVLVHGFSTPKFVWDNNIDALTNAGNRVLAYDHYGRGFSDRPKIVYNADFYARELLNLLDALNVKEPVNLVGYSMGGCNIIGFAARHPERVKKLILIAPVGYMPEYSGLKALLLVPVLGDWLMTMFGKGSLVARVEADIENGLTLPNMVENFEKQFKYRGCLPAMLSTMRHYPMHDLSKDYEKVGKLEIPVSAIWGTDDMDVPFSGSFNVKKAIPRINFFPIENAGHSVTYSRSEEVNQILIELLYE